MAPGMSRRKERYANYTNGVLGAPLAEVVEIVIVPLAQVIITQLKILSR